MADKLVTVAPNGGDYTSLQAAIVGEVTANADLTATGMDGILTISIEGTWENADTTSIAINGFTTDIDHYVNIVADSANRAGSEWDDTKYRLVISSGEKPCSIFNNYTRITGIQIHETRASDLGEIVWSYASGVLIDSCHIKGGSGSRAGIFNQAGTMCVRNTVLKNFGTGDGIYTNYGGHLYAYNCVVVGCGGIGIRAESDATIVNCYSGNNGGDDFGGASGTFTTCFSEDGTKSTTQVAFTTDTFTVITSDAENFSLVAGSDLIGVGSDLSATANYPFNWDIAGVTRVGTWDAGVYFYSAPPAEYSITYDPNGSTVGAVPVDLTQYASGQSVTVLGQGSLVKNYYDFISWNTVANGSGNNYLENDTFLMPAENEILYAQWAKHVYIANDTINMVEGGLTFAAAWQVNP